MAMAKATKVEFSLMLLQDIAHLTFRPLTTSNLYTY